MDFGKRNLDRVPLERLCGGQWKCTIEAGWENILGPARVHTLESKGLASSKAKARRPYVYDNGE